jgi:hypothetical protein
MLSAIQKRTFLSWLRAPKVRDGFPTDLSLQDRFGGILAVLPSDSSADSTMRREISRRFVSGPFGS